MHDHQINNTQGTSDNFFLANCYNVCGPPSCLHTCFALSLETHLFPACPLLKVNLIQLMGNTWCIPYTSLCVSGGPDVSEMNIQQLRQQLKTRRINWQKGVVSDKRQLAGVQVLRQQYCVLQRWNRFCSASIVMTNLQNVLGNPKSSLEFFSCFFFSLPF